MRVREGGGGREGKIRLGAALPIPGGAGQHHVRAIFADSAHFAIHLVLPVVCDRESFLAVCECRDSDQS